MASPDNRSPEERDAAFKKGLNAFAFGIALGVLTPFFPENARLIPGVAALSLIVLGVIPMIYNAPNNRK